MNLIDTLMIILKKIMYFSIYIVFAICLAFALYHLLSSSKDAEKKKRERLEEEIRQKELERKMTNNLSQCNFL